MPAVPTILYAFVISLVLHGAVLGWALNRWPEPRPIAVGPVLPVQLIPAAALAGQGTGEVQSAPAGSSGTQPEAVWAEAARRTPAIPALSALVLAPPPEPPGRLPPRTRTAVKPSPTMQPAPLRDALKPMARASAGPRTPSLAARGPAPAATRQALRIDEPPRVAPGNAAPEYPLAGRLLGLEGRVTLRVQVLASGHAGTVAVAHTSGDPLLDATAVAAVRGWRFIPARAAGLPVAGALEVPVRFDLPD